MIQDLLYPLGYRKLIQIHPNITFKNEEVIRNQDNVVTFADHA